ncbi:ABC transporter permease [Streptococcus oriscaviae]|uniref:ABC-2 family transporter protein n=1 Tax=Streptococcus oriscaviae TaxID=2781599 RepID=A0ABX7YJG5_9STRE|nr:ABC-2 family transporter protein [Streptococcus oriscaviae]QUE53962.1 ABC-2 family transporter protein [Streptococcus oriscaviae]
MRKYLYMTRLSMMTALQYKAFFLANIISLLARILVSLYVWQTIFFSQPEVNGYTLASFTSYIIFANLLASLNSFSIGEELSHSILQGQIAGEFLRPYSFIVALFFKDLGMKCVELFKFLLIFALILCLQMDFYLPDIQTMLVFLISSILGVFIVQLLDLAFGFATFFTVNAWGIYVLRNGLFNIASGALLPLSFYPDAVEKVLSFLPYNYAVNVPVTILLGKEKDLLPLGIQLVWIPILLLFIGVLWQQAQRRIVIFGG